MNQFLFRTFLTTLILLSIPLATKAYDFKYGDLYYNITSKENKTVEVTWYNSTKYGYYGPNVQGHVEIPEEVQYDGSEYSVTSIGGSAFYRSAGMTSIKIPNSVTSIGSYAFSDCTGLKSIEIPASVTSIGSNAFRDCTRLTSIEIPASVTSIMDFAFNGCTGLTSIEIPASVTSIESGAFYGCTGLASIDIPASVTSIGYEAFYGCTGLTSIEIPASVTSIGSSAFYGCTGLTSIEIPASVTSIGSSAFYGCTGLKKVVVPNSALVGSDAFSDCNKANIFAFPVPYTKIKKYSHNYADLILVGAPIFGLKNHAPHQEYYEFIIKKSMDGEPAPEGYENLTVVERGISGSKKHPCDDGGKVTIKGLKSNTEYNLSVYTKYSDGSIAVYDGKTFKTKSLGVNVAYSFYPTSFTATGSYSLDDAKLESKSIKFNGDIINGNKISLTGLKPETTYSGTYTVTTKGGSSEKKDFTFTTPALEFELLDPRPVSEKCAIVAATTNINDEEASVGFQWRKYDAPESMKWSEGYAAIYGGQLEGYIKNLQSTSYYKLRAFYKDSDGKYYHSNWITFDPSDFSYFEPTVHTYPTAEVASTSATVKGYALAGSDDIIQQGIEYWASGSHNAPKKVAAALAAADGVNTVFSTGQVMTVTLTDLKPETTYYYRAFVTTQAGTTYGEEQSFTTPEGQSGVESVIVDNEREVIGYYDLTGRRYDVPQRGLNIIVYSDGTTEKVVTRQ